MPTITGHSATDIRIVIAEAHGHETIGGTSSSRLAIPAIGAVGKAPVVGNAAAALRVPAVNATGYGTKLVTGTVVTNLFIPVVYSFATTDQIIGTSGLSLKMVRARARSSSVPSDVSPYHSMWLGL